MNSDISVANYDYDVIDELVGKCYDKEVNSSFLMAALYDGRGSVAGLTGSSGGSMITYRYDAYGNTTKSNNTLNNPYQYNAEYTDSSTGLQYLRARYYDSSQGRFTAKDTYLGNIENPLTRNLYTYCGNNPLNYIDPSGHNWLGDRWNDVKGAAKTAGNWANRNIVQPVKSAAKSVGNWLSGSNGTVKKASPVKSVTPNKIIPRAVKPSLLNMGSLNGAVRPAFGNTGSGIATSLGQKMLFAKQVAIKKIFCDTHTEEAQDDGSSSSENIGSKILSKLFTGAVKVRDFTKGIGASVLDNATAPLYSILNGITGSDFAISDLYTPIDEEAFYLGKVTGDVISMIAGVVGMVNGVATISESVVIAGGGVAVTSTGVLAPVGTVVTVVSVAGVAVGVAQAGAGIALFSGGLGNLSDDIQKYNSSKPIKNTYNSIKDSPNYPKGFTERQNGTTKNKVKNQQLLDDLRKIESGEWKKVYKDGYDANGNKISIHYFQSKSGKVFDVKVKSGWSN